MSSDRGMKTIGNESMIVFSDGTLLPYPRYRQSSNGFVRGPHNEQLARGDDGLREAREACTREIQAMLDRQARLGRVPLGCTNSLRYLDEMPKNRHKLDHSRGLFTIRLRGYWDITNDNCFDEVHFNFRLRTGCISTRSVLATPLRTLPFEDIVDVMGVRRPRYGWHSDMNTETGEVIWYSESGTSRTIERDYKPTNETSTRQSAALIWADFKSMLDTFQNKYLAWECDTDLDELDAYVQGYLDSTSIGRALSPVAAPFAEAMQQCGFDVRWTYDQSTERFRLVIRLSEHEIIISDSSDPQIQCLLEKDEERLIGLRKLRLEQELLDSINQHGDLRDTEDPK